MKIWVTGVGNPLASRAADRLGGDHDVVTSDRSVDLRVPEQVAPLAAEVEAIVHSAMPQVGTSTDEEMLEAMAWAMRELRVVLEPSGAAALAGAMREGRGRCGVILTGGNLSDEMLRQAAMIPEDRTS